MLTDPRGNVDNIHEERENFSNELEAVKKKKKRTKGILEMKNMISEI